MSIHPTAVIDPQAEVDSSVEIGPYSVVGPHVRLAAGVVLHPHSYVTGYTEIGPETHVFSFAAVGEIPQDKKYRGEPTRLVIGARNRIREHVTLHPGTAGGGGLTTVGRTTATSAATSSWPTTWAWPDTYASRITPCSGPSRGSISSCASAATP
jgi:acyl-ACP--UDP-N-acetylglucosamine O-acyltransferase